MWLALGALVLAGVLYAPNQSLALGKAVTYWVLVILSIFPAAMRVGARPRYVSQFLWTFFLMGILTVVLGVAQLSGSNRLMVLGMNTIQVGRAALLVPLIGIAYVLPQRRLLPSLVTIVMIPVAVVVAIASGSRGPLLALVVIAVAGTARHLAIPRATRWRVLGAGVGIVLVSVVVIGIVGPRLPALSLARFTSLVEFVQGGSSGNSGSSGGDTSAAARVRLFQYAAELAAERPIIGAGTGGFEALSPRVLGLGADAYPHNAVLQIASEYGLLGLALFLGVISIALARRLPGRYTGRTVRILFVFALLNAMVSGDILTDRELLGLLLLVLTIEVSRVVADDVSLAAIPIDPSRRILDVVPAPQAMAPLLEPAYWSTGRFRHDRSATPEQWI